MWGARSQGLMWCVSNACAGRDARDRCCSKYVGCDRGGNTLPKFWKRLKVHGTESGLARFKETSTYLTDIIVEDVKEAANSWLPISRGSVCCDVIQAFKYFSPAAARPPAWTLELDSSPRARQKGPRKV